MTDFRRWLRRHKDRSLISRVISNLLVFFFVFLLVLLPMQGLHIASHMDRVTEKLLRVR